MISIPDFDSGRKSLNLLERTKNSEELSSEFFIYPFINLNTML
jgi:hypothetical protein